MNPTRLQNHAVERFVCLGAECPDTCCKGWSMQLTAETVEQYRAEAPELLAAVDNTPAGLIMKRDPATGGCVRLDGGSCSTHRDYGDRFLGDACHFFPRVTRALGTTVMTSVSLSCPEAARLMLFTEDAFGFSERQEVRTPYSLRNYLPDGMSEEGAVAIHHAFLNLMGDANVTAEHSVMRVNAVARAIAMQPMSAWVDAVPLYIMMADGRIPAAEPAPADLFNLVHALRGLIGASEDKRASLHAVVDAMAMMLGIAFNEAGALSLAEDASARGVRALAIMRAQAPILQPILRRYLQAQMAVAHFPFAGFGTTLAERASIIGVRFATMKLGLATLGESPEASDIIRVVQTISRFMDHLGDPALSLQIYQETCWLREPRLRALIGD
ncbi:MAG: flagellin lysine-N-methylase [Rickettsiales bacterium]